jgi:hypothetical protein
LQSKAALDKVKAELTAASVEIKKYKSEAREWEKEAATETKKNVELKEKMEESTQQWQVSRDGGL